ncbi:MAG TPA: DUF6174 domain-containing protein [Longimicrobium sp.]|jgi:hypothetical protein
MRLKLRLLCIALLAAAGCSDSPLEPWEKKQYTYDFQMLCRCASPLTTPVSIHVRDGRVRSVFTRPGPQVVSVPVDGPFPTIEDLILEIARARAKGHKVTVRYDEELGYPTSIAFGAVGNHDAGHVYKLGNLQTEFFER